MVSDAKEIPIKMQELLYKYYNEWKGLDPFEREARFHIDFIRIHPFEDGNHWTIRLLLAYNLLKQGIAPAVITSDLEEYYGEYRNNKDYLGMANILKIQSIKESEILKNSLENYNLKERWEIETAEKVYKDYCK